MKKYMLIAVSLLLCLSCLCACQDWGKYYPDSSGTNALSEAKSKAMSEVISAMDNRGWDIYYNLWLSEFDFATISGSESSGYMFIGRVRLYDKYGNYGKTANFTVKIYTDGTVNTEVS